MAITAQLFDGTTLEFPDDTDKSIIQDTVKRLTEEKQVKPDTGFTGAFKSGTERFKGDVAAVLGRTGIMNTEAAEQYKAHKERLAEKMFTPTQEGWSEAPFTKFKETLGGSLPYTAAPLAVGLGAAALPAIGVAAPIATGIGMAGAGLASLGQFTGSNLSRQMQENPNLRLKDTDLMAAGAAAVPQAALDVVSLRMIPGIGKIFGAAGKEVTPELAKRIAEQGILKTAGYYGVEGVKLAGKEGATEAGQQFFERLQAGLNIADEQARSEYFDNFIGGAVLGGALSVPGVAIERRNIVKQGAQMEEEQKRQAIIDRQKAQREAYLAEQEQLKQTSQNLGVPETLALPAPEEKLEAMPEEVDPLINPLGRFKSTDLSPKEVAEVNKRRKDMGKPRIGHTFSIEDLADVFTIPKNLDPTDPEDQKTIQQIQQNKDGILNRLVAARTGYQAGQDFAPQTIELSAQQRGIDTRTQGFKDFLTRVAGEEDLTAMSPPQRVAVAQALQNVKPGEESRILEAGISNAKHYTAEQYNDTIAGLHKEFKQMGNQENGRSSVLKLIEKYSGLKNERDQQRILDEAVKNGDFERNLKVSSTGHNIETLKPAEAITPLPGGMDIRKETFKQGETPEAFVVRAGSKVLSSVETAEEADRDLAAHEQNRQAAVVNTQKQIQGIQNGINARNAELNQMQSLGQDQTDEFFTKSAQYYGADQQANAAINDLRQKQQEFMEPVRVIPVGTKPVAKESYTFYEKDQPQVKFDTEEQAEQYGISRLDDATLEQIIRSAPHQKQTGRVKRYADLAQKELDERNSLESERGIAVTTTQGLKGSKERLEKLGIYNKEVHDNLEKLRQTLLPALKRYGLEKVALRILNSIEDGKADGYYIEQVMAIALDAKNPMGTLRHESIHALKELGAFTPQEWKILENKAKSEWVQKYIKDANLYESYKQQYIAEHGNLVGFEPYIQEEAIAEAFKHFKVGTLPAGMIGNIWSRLNKMFEALRNAFNKLGFQTSEDIFNKIEQGEKKPKEAGQAQAGKYDLTKRIDMTFKDVTKRVPQLVAAAKKVASGEMTAAQYDKLVNKYKPILPYDFIPEPATAKEAIDALTSDKKPFYGKTDEIPNGHPVGLRLDIPAYKDHGVWVNSIHNEGAKGSMPNAVYSNVASIKNANFEITERNQERFLDFAQEAVSAKGEKQNKFTGARIYGNWNPMSEKETVATAKKVLNNPAWSQVGMDPERHSYFYDRKTTQPIVSADEVIQIGPLVFAKNPVYSSKKNFKYSLRTNASEADLKNSLADKRVSPRLPISAKNTEDVYGVDRLQPDLNTFKKEAVPFNKNIEILSKYPNFEGLTGSNEEKANSMVDQMVDNLMWLFNHWKPELRERSRLWYVGGNRISTRWSERYGLPAENIAAVIAALSPQKDWFQNVRLGESILDAMVFNSTTPWDESMSAVLNNREWGKKFSKELKYSPSQQISRFQGKTLKDLYDPKDDASLLDMAVWIRAWDEAKNPQVARVITPEGNFSNDVDVGKTGKPVALRAQGFNAMTKALKAIQAKGVQEISELIGANHKVRSFYNNIIAPFDKDDVTIDTHAVAAALLRPLGSSDAEVGHNFGSYAPKSAITGLNGTYALYAEAYRRAAEKAGVLPREMQSITWEAVRGLFRPEQKTDTNKTKADNIWKEYANGKITANEAREKISGMVQGIKDPAWVRSTAGNNETETDSTYKGELPQVSVPSGNENISRTTPRSAKNSRVKEKFSLRAPETPEFKQFFKDTKVVDNDGKPMQMYHGTAEDLFTVFDKAKIRASDYDTPFNGFWFSNDKFTSPAMRDAKNTIPVYLNIKNPAPSEAWRKVSKDVYRESDEGSLVLSKGSRSEGDEIRNRLQAMGYDGVHYGGTPDINKNEFEKNGYTSFKDLSGKSYTIAKNDENGGVDLYSGKVNEKPTYETEEHITGYLDLNDFLNTFENEVWVAFEPNQIKSVTNEKPTESEDIRYSLRSQLSDDLNERIGITTTKRQEKGYVDRIIDAISPTAITRIRQGLINKYESIEQLSRLRGEKMGGDQLLAENSAIAAALQSDRAAGIAASSFRDGVPVLDKGYTYVTDMDGKVKGLIPILEPLMKYKDPYIFQTFQYYAGTRRGRRLDAEGREKTFTKEDIAYGKELEMQFPEFSEVFNEYQKYNQGLVKYMMDTGVISAQEAKTWTENWDYIPFYRQLEGEKTAGPKVFSPIAGVAKPKKLKGSEAPLDDFMETIVRNARAAIEAGMKNEAARRVIRDVTDFGLGERLPSSQSGSDVVSVKENGMTVYYRVADPLLVESLKGLNLPQLPFMDFLSAPANLLRNFVTKDPGFIIANLGRDSMQAWITSGTDMKPLVDTFKQFGKELAGQSPEAYALAKAGLTGYDFAGDVKSTAKQVEKELRKRSGARTKGEQALLPLTSFWEMLEHGSHASDMATRAEVYKRTLERTGSEAEAFYQAMEVMNFSRKGNSAVIRILSAMIPFFNARVQGLDVLYRTGFGKTAMENKETIQKAFIFRSMVLLGTSVMYWGLMQDDDDYKKLSKEEKDNYWIIPAIKIGDKPFRFPIPFELGVLFKVLPERALEYSFGTDTGKDLRESLFRNAMSTLSFNPIPQAALPLVENATNHSFFTGEPIIGKGVEGLAPQFQFGAGTSEFAKKLGKELGYSPQKIDNLIRGYTGTMGSYAMMMMDSALTQEGDSVKAAKRMEQLPVLKRFFAGDMGNISAYYDLKQEVDTVVQTVNTLQRTGNSDDLKEYLEENKKLYALKSYIGVLDKNMKQFNNMAKMINASKTMTADEKREALDKIHEGQLKLTERVRILRKQQE